MKISTKGRYALRLMLDIAEHSEGNTPVSIKDIAKRQEISDKYLEQIISVLNKAQLPNYDIALYEFIKEKTGRIYSRNDFKINRRLISSCCMCGR